MAKVAQTAPADQQKVEQKKREPQAEPKFSKKVEFIRLPKSFCIKRAKRDHHHDRLLFWLCGRTTLEAREVRHNEAWEYANSQMASERKELKSSWTEPRRKKDIKESGGVRGAGERAYKVAQKRLKGRGLPVLLRFASMRALMKEYGLRNYDKDAARRFDQLLSDLKREGDLSHYERRTHAIEVRVSDNTYKQLRNVKEHDGVAKVPWPIPTHSHSPLPMRLWLVCAAYGWFYHEPMVWDPEELCEVIGIEFESRNAAYIVKRINQALAAFDQHEFLSERSIELRAELDYATGNLAIGQTE